MWGEEAEGWAKALHPKAVAGEPRRLPESIPSFFTLLGKFVSTLRSDIGTAISINSGMGSTCTRKYIKEFWECLVMRHNPDLVILEFAINDWIFDREVSVDEFKENLEYMASNAINSGADVLLLTVSPILGDQYSGSHYYEDYINASREVALSNSGIILVDANLRMKEFLKCKAGKEAEESLFHDIWHVSQIGHELYFRCIIEAL